MNSDFLGPVNIGSEEMISINEFAKMIINISGKNIGLINIQGPEGDRGRNSDNKMILEKLGWKPSQQLIDGMKETYKWIKRLERWILIMLHNLILNKELKYLKN